MRKKNFSLTSIVTMFLVCLFSITASANSSWVWISETRPLDILPAVIIGTLIIEILAIKYVGKTNNTLKTSLVVILANLLSFAMPYVVHISAIMNDKIYTIEESFERGPVYTVGLAFLIMTLAVEVPICSLLLKNNTENKKRLMITIALTNVVTTVLVAIVERTICTGQW